MTLALKKQSDTQWQLQGDVNVDTIKPIIDQGYQMINAVPKGQTLTLDLSGVKQADSASVALLLDWMRYAKKNKKTLSFSEFPRKMKDIIKVSNLEEIL